MVNKRTKEKMKCGLFFLNSIPPWKSDAQELKDGLEQIKKADELGFDTAWIAEHNARTYGAVSSTAVYMAAAAAQTKNINLASGVSRLPLHHPLQLAENMALVDIISDGRLYIGVGKGYDAYEFEAYNVDFDERHDKYIESLDVLTTALSDDKVTYSGHFYNIQDVPVYPRPIQKPSPPIFVMVSQNDLSIINAAKKGYSFMLGGISHEDTLHKINLYRETALESGFSEEEVTQIISRSGKLLFNHVSETDEKAEKEYEKGLTWYMGERDNRPTFGVIDRERNVDYDKFLQSENTIVGSPETVTEKLLTYREETGLNNVILWMNIGGQPQKNVLNSMQIFSEKVLPNL